MPRQDIAVQLEEDSQPLTTFRTPFGRYCWKRLPFGLRVSQDIFQARMDEILEGLNGVVGIADDVAVFGATEAEHNHNLLKLMERAKQEGKFLIAPSAASETTRSPFLEMSTQAKEYAQI